MAPKSLADIPDDLDEIDEEEEKEQVNSKSPKVIQIQIPHITQGGMLPKTPDGRNKGFRINLLQDTNNREKKQNVS